jgi:uncharacterized protein YndB with AHSA1/START domain
MDTNRIEQEITIAAPIEQVWATITEPRHVGVWFGNGTPTTMDFRPGGTLVFDHAPHGEIHAKIERIEPRHLFSWRWTTIGPPNTPPTDGNSTLVEFTLHPEDNGTRLRVTETGFTTLHATPTERDARFKSNTGGWADKLAEIDAYVQRLPA